MSSISTTTRSHPGRQSGATCRKILERARENVGREKRAFSASREEHRRLLDAFMRAASAGDAAALVEVLSEDAVMVTDGGPTGRRVGTRASPPTAPGRSEDRGVRALATARNVELRPEIHELNGQPAAVLYGEQQAPFAAILLGVSEGRIHRVFFHADLARLRRLGWRAS